MEKTSAELRIEFANSQRTKKIREKYLEMAMQINEFRRFSEKTTHDGITIGSVVKWTETIQKLGGYHIRMKEGRAFAFDRNAMLVIYLGKIRQVRLSNVEVK
tara:strand:+ start:738 stop:1043 length:306 start_codon:yes stop_codon:yes gene_type:complete